GVGAFFMSICCTVLPSSEAVYSLVSCRGSTLLAWVHPAAMGLRSTVVCSTLLADSLCYGCLPWQQQAWSAMGVYLSRGGLHPYWWMPLSHRAAP
ncbi:hypothetical protein P7K49_039531, partial [Saguinus oedipus]